MSEDKFKKGDIVYHKASLTRGVVTAKLEGDKYRVTLSNHEEDVILECELYTEKEGLSAISWGKKKSS